MTKIRRLKDSENGAALPTVAILLVALLGMAALAVDLGWFYLNGARLQRAADSASLAGVAHLPLSVADADIDAAAAANANGFGSAGIDTEVLEDNRYKVTLSTDITTFFAGIVGVDSLHVVKTSTAQNLPPLALGNRGNQFGNICKPGETPGCSGQDNFWANLHGTYTDTKMGDARSSYCDEDQGSGSASCAQNPNYRSSGYLYGIELTTAGGFQVRFKDISFHNISGGIDTEDTVRTGDRGCEEWGDSDADCGQTVITRLYAPDNTPLDLSDNGLPLCSATWDPVAQVDESDPYPWQDFCTISPARSGIYVLQVVPVTPPDATDSGLNRYSVVVSPGTRIYGLGDFSVYNNVDGTTQFDIAEVPDYYKGKTFVVEAWDPGDTGKPGTLSIVAPPGVTPSACRMYTRSNSSDWSQHSASCTESVAPDEFQAEWIKFEIDLPADYSCGADCWFRVEYVYADATDTTTWTAYMIGDPLRLVPNP